MEDGNVFYDESVHYNVNDVYIAAKQFIKNQKIYNQMKKKD